MRAQSYVSAARRIAELASHVEDLAGATEPRRQAARTQAIHALLQAAQRLQRRNAHRDRGPATPGDVKPAADQPTRSECQP